MSKKRLLHFSSNSSFSFITTHQRSDYEDRRILTALTCASCTAEAADVKYVLELAADIDATCCQHTSHYRNRVNFDTFDMHYRRTEAADVAHVLEVTDVIVALTSHHSLPTWWRSFGFLLG